MTDGLLTQQLNARKKYRDADERVQAHIVVRDRAQQAIRDAEENLADARRHLASLVNERRRWADECERLGISP